MGIIVVFIIPRGEKHYAPKALSLVMPNTLWPARRLQCFMIKNLKPFNPGTLLAIGI